MKERKFVSRLKAYRWHSATRDLDCKEKEFLLPVNLSALEQSWTWKSISLHN